MSAGSSLPCGHLLSQHAGRSCDLGPGAVGDAEVQRERGTVGRLRDDTIDRAASTLAQLVQVAQHPDRHALLPKLGGLPRDVFLQQLHQGFDLAGRTLPVLLAEGEERQNPYAGLQTALDHLADRFHPGMMAQRTGQRASLGPAAIAIHDDGDVAGNRAMNPQPLQQIVAHPVRLPGSPLLWNESAHRSA